ncbi:uncharacterized protein LOC129596503 [Paramacrobiotus metropolitanus]|uniref:uncharacterized protein LOC129596503 n=1 Tax=Paramacrobiotus metropolitanus TaxID=2943436 RepID=UPI0024465624|nr:uncharacterized protein LOC129596503 [Paramacrobiotus metropolitanus]
MLLEDFVRLYENNRYGIQKYVLLKELKGNVPGYHDPASVSQALTSYVTKPSFTLEYHRSSSSAAGYHEAFIDFVITEDTPHSMNSRCSALSGYVSNIFICDTDGVNNRVNCPIEFLPTVAGYNPSFSRQCTNRPATSPPYYYYSSTPNYWNTQSSHDNGLGPGAITGIVMGCVCFVVFLIVVVAEVCARRKISRNRPIVPTSTRGTLQTSRPIVADAPVFAVGPTPPFMGAPPSYEEVTASPAQGSVPMPQPPIPKF